jgi:hypothetical protein
MQIFDRGSSPQFITPGNNTLGVSSGFKDVFEVFPADFALPVSSYKGRRGFLAVEHGSARMPMPLAEDFIGLFPLFARFGFVEVFDHALQLVQVPEG